MRCFSFATSSAAVRVPTFLEIGIRKTPGLRSTGVAATSKVKTKRATQISMRNMAPCLQGFRRDETQGDGRLIVVPDPSDCHDDAFGLVSRVGASFYDQAKLRANYKVHMRLGTPFKYVWPPGPRTSTCDHGHSWVGKDTTARTIRAVNPRQLVEICGCYTVHKRPESTDRARITGYNEAKSFELNLSQYNEKRQLQ